MGAGRRAPPDHGDVDDDPDELGVFAAERYFYGDDALWCGRSSSSLSSVFRTGTGTIEHDRSVPTPTAATSSSEASWNSRSALLPNEPPPADKLRGVASGNAGALDVEADPPSGAESGRTGFRGRMRASSMSSNNLRRWLLGVAGCACAGGDGDDEELVSADEMEDNDGVLVVAGGGKKSSSDASRLSSRTEMIPEPAFEEAAAATVRSGSARWVLDGDRVLAGWDAFSPVDIAGQGHRRSANLVELSTPAVLHPEAAAPSDERRRVKSWEKFTPLCDDQGSAIRSAAQQNSAFTIVAGNAPRTAVVGGGAGGSLGAEDDGAAPSELGCAYPPSEASVVWSVVTADGAASGNFSSAASGYYHYFTFGEDGALRRYDAAKCDRRRRGGIATTTSLLACMSDKAVDAVGPAQPVHRPAVEPPVAAVRLGPNGGSRNGHGGGYNDVVRRRVGR